MRKKLLALAAVGLLATATMTACDDSNKSSDAGSGSGSGGGSGKARVGVILPDTESSTRWKDVDAKYLKQAFDAQNVPVEIVNAEGDKANFVKIGTDMINSGVKVLMIANLVLLASTMMTSTLLPPPPETNRKVRIPGSQYNRTPVPAGAVTVR